MATTIGLVDLLDSDPNHRGGRPFIVGTRLSVDRIAVMHGWGWSPERIAHEHDLAMWQVYAGLAFYLSHRAEIDDDIRRADEEYDRLADAWKRGVKADTPEWRALLNPGPFPTETDFGGLVHVERGLLAGTELTVTDIAERYAAGASPEQIAAETGAPLPNVFAALALHMATQERVSAVLREDPGEYEAR